MQQFRWYPIYVVYSKARQEFMEQQIDRYAAGNDPGIFDWAQNVGRNSESIRPDKESPESRHYETTILNLLNKIESNKVGGLLLESLAPGSKIYIHPLTERTRHSDCYKCTGLTTWWEMTLKQGGGRRIAFSPELVKSDQTDDVLVHELMHAYRGESKMRARRGIGLQYPDGEEFIAHYIENMYRSAKGRADLEFSYYRHYAHASQFGTKSSIYHHIVENEREIFAFRFFLDSDPLCANLAKKSWPAFNPFRDFQILHRLSLNSKLTGEYPMTMEQVREFWPSFFTAVGPNDY